MRGLPRHCVTALAVSAVLAWPCETATAAEVDIGARDGFAAELEDHVPGLRVGTTAPGFDADQLTLSANVERPRCDATLDVHASLLPGPLPAYPGRQVLAPRRLVLRPRRALRVERTRYESPEPAVAVVLEGRLPPGVAPFEPRRRVVVTVSSFATEGRRACRRAVRGDVDRVLPTVYLRVDTSAPAPIPPVPSPERRIDRSPLDRLGGPGAIAGLGAEIDAAGDVDGDGHADLLFQERDDSDFGRRRRGIVRFGGAPGLADAAGLGAGGLRLAGGSEAATFGSGFAAAGSFLGPGPTALGIGVEGSQRGSGRPPTAQETAALVIPGGRHPGGVRPSRVPGGSLRITVGRACSSEETQVEGVGDVNGDGRDDLGVYRADGCGEGSSAIVFGGRAGTVSLDSLGGRGMTFRPDEADTGFTGVGDVNGDGRDDVALVSPGDGEDALDELIVVLGRRTGGRVRVGGVRDGVIRFRRRGCQDLAEVAPAGDMDGDGDGELLFGIADCQDRLLHPVVAEIVPGGPGTRGARSVRAPGGTTIRSRFGPLNRTQVAVGHDIGGGPGPDLALGFPGAGDAGEGEAWLIRDVRLGEAVTLGAVGQRASRLVGPREGRGFATDLTMTGDVTGDGRADLVIGSPEEEFAGRTEAGTAYTYGPRTASSAPCSLRLTATGRIRGTDGGDRLTGAAGADRIVGFLGDDCLEGGGGSDRLVGDPGWDRLLGGAGSDRLSGGDGRDRLDGGDGDDILDGGTRGDVLIGGRGADQIDARYGAGDRVDAGPGDDLVRSAERALDHIDCGAGIDRAVVDPGDVVRRCERVVRRRSPKTD